MNFLAKKYNQHFRRKLIFNTSSVDFSYIYELQKKEFQDTGEPVEVNFREIITSDTGIDKHTHLIHKYPAKLLRSIPYFFLNSSTFVGKKKIRVLDPFSGSGTVLLESIILGHDAMGADANPMARLITKVKTTSLNPDKLKYYLEKIISKASNKNLDLDYEPQKLLDWDYWFSEESKNSLKSIIVSVDKIRNSDVRDFFKVCFSNCVGKVSYSDPNVSVPVKLNPERFHKDSHQRKKADEYLDKINNIDVFEVFEKVCNANINRMKKLYETPLTGSVKSISHDSRSLNIIKDESVDLIITSPPYGGAQKYIRSTSLNIGWLNLCKEDSLSKLDKLNIGRENYSKNEYKDLVSVPSKEASEVLKKIWIENPLRAHISANYLNEMYKVLSECYRVLKKDRRFVLVIGNNLVAGYNFESHKYLSEISKQLGFQVECILRDDIKSRGLMTKRNKTASIIACEWIIVLKK